MVGTPASHRLGRSADARRAIIDLNWEIQSVDLAAPFSSFAQQPWLFPVMLGVYWASRMAVVGKRSPNWEAKKKGLTTSGADRRRAILHWTVTGSELPAIAAGPSCDGHLGRQAERSFAHPTRSQDANISWANSSRSHRILCKRVCRHKHKHESPAMTMATAMRVCCRAVDCILRALGQD